MGSILQPAACVLADKEVLLCGPQTGCRQEGWLGIGWGTARRGSRPVPTQLPVGMETPAPPAWGAWAGSWGERLGPL